MMHTNDFIFLHLISETFHMQSTFYEDLYR